MSFRSEKVQLSNQLRTQGKGKPTPSVSGGSNQVSVKTSSKGTGNLKVPSAKALAGKKYGVSLPQF